ncbi:MAG: transketolase-like TK C-terminal-containing protein, partial [Bacillota bacterium]
LMASGSETSLAVEIAELLQEKDKKVRILSIPDRDKFVKNNKEQLEKILGDSNTLKVALEAGIGQGWYRLLDNEDIMISVESFGASGPGEEVYREFGFDPEKITKDILKKL